MKFLTFMFLFPFLSIAAEHSETTSSRKVTDDESTLNAFQCTKEGIEASIGLEDLDGNRMYNLHMKLQEGKWVSATEADPEGRCVPLLTSPDGKIRGRVIWRKDTEADGDEKTKLSTFFGKMLGLEDTRAEGKYWIFPNDGEEDRFDMDWLPAQCPAQKKERVKVFIKEDEKAETKTLRFEMKDGTVTEVPKAIYLAEKLKKEQAALSSDPGTSGSESH